MWVAEEPSIAPPIETRGTGGDCEIAVASALREREYSIDVRECGLRTQIRPAFQLSGTVNVTELDGGASQLKVRQCQGLRV